MTWEGFRHNGWPQSAQQRHTAHAGGQVEYTHEDWRWGLLGDHEETIDRMSEEMKEQDEENARLAERVDVLRSRCEQLLQIAKGHREQAAASERSAQILASYHLRTQAAKIIPEDF